MVDIRTLSVGDRVKIVDEWCDGCFANGEGEMNHWLGEVMTVRYIDDSPGEHCVKMVEDEDEFFGGWSWFPAAIDRIVSSDMPASSPPSESELSNFLLRK